MRKIIEFDTSHDGYRRWPKSGHWSNPFRIGHRWNVPRAVTRHRGRISSCFLRQICSTFQAASSRTVSVQLHAYPHKEKHGVYSFDEHLCQFTSHWSPSSSDDCWASSVFVYGKSVMKRRRQFENEEIRKCLTSGVPSSSIFFSGKENKKKEQRLGFDVNHFISPVWGRRSQSGADSDVWINIACS